MTTPVNKVNGIGPKTTEYLKKRKISTAEALIKAGATVLARAPGFSVSRADNTLKAAIRLINEAGTTPAKSSSKVKLKSEKSGKKDKKKDKKKQDKKDKTKKGKKGEKGKKGRKGKRKDKNKK